MSKSHIPSRSKPIKKQAAQLGLDATKLFQHGLNLHQHGQLAKAKEAYEQVIAKQQNHFDALHLLGVIYIQTNHPNLAVTAIEKAIAINPKFPSAYSHLGMALSNLNRLDDALASYEKAIAIKPDYAEAFNSRGNLFKRLGRIEDALNSYEKAILHNENYAEAFNNRGTALHELGRPAEALASYDRAIALKPDYANAHNNRGTSLQKLNRKAEALASYDKAITINPNYAEVFNNRGNILEEIGHLEKALENYDKAIALKEEYAEAFNNRGTTLYKLHRLDDAVKSYEKAIIINPNYATAFNNYGNLLKELMRNEEALASYNKAIELNPDYAEAMLNRGTLLQVLNRHEEALTSYDKALSLNPELAEALNNKGTVLQQLHRLNEALSSYGKAIELKPDYTEALFNYGAALQELNRLDEALSYYENAITKNPRNTGAFINRGNILKRLRRPEEALKSYEHAITLEPDYEYLTGTITHLKMHLCDWTEIYLKLNKIEKSIYENKKIAAPFPVLGLIDKPGIQMNAALIYTNDKYPDADNSIKFKNRKSHEKIRIGYYSSDFYNHATSILMAELFESHNKHKFEIFAFSYGPSHHDKMRSRIVNAFDHFIDISSKSDLEVQKMSLEFQIDIAIDLKGFTENSRTRIFSMRCAPVQINYLGYPGTLGANYYDYIIADKHIIPKEYQKYYTEKIIYMPHSYQVNDSKRHIARKEFTRRELGLPESGFIFCCFNNNYKILPKTFEIWMRLLKRVEGSVLWLLEGNQTVKSNLMREAEIRGVDPVRLIFAPRLEPEYHLARHSCADLFLDTLPCNAHTTASDALWAGLPVLTQTGQSFAGRVAGSLLNALDLQQLITFSDEEYEAKAIELANDRLKLSNIRKILENNRFSSNLFNGKIYAMNIEAAFLEIHRKHSNNEQPDHIDVEALFTKDHPNNFA